MFAAAAPRFISSLSHRIFSELHSFCPDTHIQRTMWTKPIAVLLVCITPGAAANLFDADYDERVVADDAEAPPPHNNTHSNHHLFDVPVEEEESERYTCRSIVAIAYAPQPLNDRKKGDDADATIAATEQLGQRRRLRKKKKKKKYADAQKKGSSDDDEEEQHDHHQEEGFACELDDGQDVPIEATSAQLEEMRAALLNGTLISAVSTMDVDMFDNTVEEEEVEDTQYVVDSATSSETTTTNNPPSSSGHSKSAKLPPGPIHLSTNSRRLAEHPQRRLNKLTGTKRLLVVRIIDSDGLEPAGNAAYYSNKFFGTGGDLETPKSQLNGCSHGGEFIRERCIIMYLTRSCYV